MENLEIKEKYNKSLLECSTETKLNEDNIFLKEIYKIESKKLNEYLTQVLADAYEKYLLKASAYANGISVQYEFFKLINEFREEISIIPSNNMSENIINFTHQKLFFTNPIYKRDYYINYNCYNRYHYTPRIHFSALETKINIIFDYTISREFITRSEYSAEYFSVAKYKNLVSMLNRIEEFINSHKDYSIIKLNNNSDNKSLNDYLIYKDDKYYLLINDFYFSKNYERLISTLLLLFKYCFNVTKECQEFKNIYEANEYNWKNNDFKYVYDILKEEQIKNIDEYFENIEIHNLISSLATKYQEQRNLEQSNLENLFNQYKEALKHLDFIDKTLVQINSNIFQKIKQTKTYLEQEKENKDIIKYTFRLIGTSIMLDIFYPMLPLVYVDNNQLETSLHNYGRGLPEKNIEFAKEVINGKYLYVMNSIEVSIKLDLINNNFRCEFHPYKNIRESKNMINPHASYRCLGTFDIELVNALYENNIVKFLYLIKQYLQTAAPLDPAGKNILECSVFYDQETECIVTLNGNSSVENTPITELDYDHLYIHKKEE